MIRDLCLMNVEKEQVKDKRAGMGQNASRSFRRLICVSENTVAQPSSIRGDCGIVIASLKDSSINNLPTLKSSFWLVS